jgi:hypothetical protein
MMNQLTKLVIMRLRSVPASREKLVLGYQGTLVSLRLPRKGSAFTNKIQWSALSYHELGGKPWLTEEVWSAFVKVNRGKLSVE